MKEVSSCKENIDMEASAEDKKKREAESVAQANGLFAGKKCPVIMKILTWKQSESIPNYTELIAQPIGPFAFYLIVWTALFDKRSLPWRSVAEASLVNHERFPSRDVLKSAFKWSNLIRKVRD